MKITINNASLGFKKLGTNYFEGTTEGYSSQSFLDDVVLTKVFLRQAIDCFATASSSYSIVSRPIPVSKDDILLVSVAASKVASNIVVLGYTGDGQIPTSLLKVTDETIDNPEGSSPYTISNRQVTIPEGVTHVRVWSGAGTPTAYKL